MNKDRHILNKVLSSGLRWIRSLSALRIAGGLSVNDSAIRYVRFSDDGSFTKTSLRLPPGIMEGGKIKDRALLTKALISLKNRIVSKENEAAEIIISLESRVVYSQFFNLPELDEAGIEEAANLNIQMISPIPLTEAYSGYEKIGKPSSGIGNEFLAAFVSAPIIDEWVLVLKEAGFLPVAIEFQSLSIVRLIHGSGVLDESGISLIVDISDESIDLGLIRNGNLYFDYFYPWKMIQGDEKSISPELFESTLSAEVSKVMNFALSKFGGAVRSVIVNSDSLGDKAISSLSAKFPSVSVIKAPVEESLCCSWAAASGAAKRGLLTRSEDNLISLMPVKVAEEYFRSRLFSMISIWRRTFALILLFFVFTFGASDLLFRSIRISSANQPVRNLSSAEATELASLRREAIDFNSLISLVSEANREEIDISPIISKITSAAGDVTITKISIQNILVPVTLSGDAPSADSIARFTRRLGEIKNISEIQLPLSSIISSPNGQTSFSMSFKIISLEI